MRDKIAPIIIGISCLIYFISLLLVRLGKIEINSEKKSFHQAYLLDVSSQQFDRRAFENKSNDYDLDYDFIEAQELKLRQDKYLEVHNAEIWSANQEASLVLTPRVKIVSGCLTVTSSIIYLKRYHLDKKGNYTDTYYYEIYGRQKDGTYFLIEKGSDQDRY